MRTFRISSNEGGKYKNDFEFSVLVYENPVKVLLSIVGAVICGLWWRHKREKTGRGSH